MADRENIIKGTVYNYRFIDHGAQYRVYVISIAGGEDTGRVIKVPLTFDESKRVLEPHLSRIGHDQEEVDRRIHQLMIRKQQLPALVQGMTARDKRLMYSLGNLKLVPVLTTSQKTAPDYLLPLYFTQDYVMPMSHFMHSFRFMRQQLHPMAMRDARRARKLMAAIVNLHYRLWEYGIFDIALKLENVGVVIRNGDVVDAILVDGAEHTYDLNEAHAVIAEQKWRHCLNPVKSDHLFLPIILHEEYASAMSNGLTAAALEKHWQKKSNAIERHKSRNLRIKQLLAFDQKKRLQLWMERQGIHNELRQGIPRSSIDTMNIPYADLLLLMSDDRAGIMPLTAIADREKAERTMYSQTDQTMNELYRHTFSTSQN